MSTSDEQIGRNLVRLRGDRTQKDLAAAMRARGWKWSQATVWSIEKGERPLRLAEAQDLAEILDVFPREFTQSEAGSKLREARAHALDLQRLFDKMVEDYAMALWWLAVTADDTEGLGEPERESIIDILSVTPSTLLSDARARIAIRDKAQAEIENLDGILSEEDNERLFNQAHANRGEFQKLVEDELKVFGDDDG